MMSHRKESKAVPCQECRSRHVKCDGKKPTCHRCERAGTTCAWTAPKIRFRHGSNARYDAQFAADQPWLTFTDVGSSEYVDETADIASYYSQDPSQDTSQWSFVRNRSSSSATDQRSIFESPSPSETTQSKSKSNRLSLPTKQQRTDDLPNYQSNSPQSFPGNGPSTYSPSANLSHHSPPLSVARGLVSHGVHDSPVSLRPQFNVQEACLMRYFIDQLAKWFDLCDGERHFATTVPSQAMKCPPLLNAIYTASARHLSRVKKHYVGNQVQYAGKVLPNLKPETAIYYHNRCIEYLVSLSDNPLEAKDENLLAAAVVLRFYEEVDAPYMGEDSESAFRGIQVFLDTQAMSATVDSGLRHAAFWVALRQEVLTAFSKQRPFRLPLEPCDSYRSFEPANDYVWADRLVIHCADVLQYCFGSEFETIGRDQSYFVAAADMTAAQRTAWYEELVAFDTLWTEIGPASFTPVYARDADRSRGEVFPELWYLNDCHVIGIQHLELARILLAVYNPKIPRLGPGQRIAMRSVDLELKSIVKRLCGIALSNQQTPPGLITACVAIGMCGDRFTDRAEQQSLLAVLVKLEDEHAWPTHTTQKLLKEAWGWYEVDNHELIVEMNT